MITRSGHAEANEAHMLDAIEIGLGLLLISWLYIINSKQ